LGGKCYWTRKGAASSKHFAKTLEIKKKSHAETSPWGEKNHFYRGKRETLNVVLPQVLFAKGRELVHRAVFQGGRKIVPGLHYPEGKNSLSKLVPDGSRCSFVHKGPSPRRGRRSVMRAMALKSVAPLEKDQVGVLQVHGHRHHLLLEWRRRVKICKKSHRN
jgi:hypothetical protein